MGAGGARGRDPYDAVKRVAPMDIVDESTGEVILECNVEIQEAHLEELRSRGITQFPLLYLDPISTGTALRDTLLADKTPSQDEAILDIYRRLRLGRTPGEVAIAWTLRNPAVTGAIVGARSAEQAEGVMRAADLHLSDEDVAEIEGRQ